MEPTLTASQFTQYATVIPDRHLDKPLDYGVPLELQNSIKPGQRVSFSLRGKMCKGTVLSLQDATQFEGIKPIENVLSEDGVLSSDLFALSRWMSQYYATSINQALSCILPSALRTDTKEKKQLTIKNRLTKPKLVEYIEETRHKYPKQAEILDLILKKPEGVLLTELLEKAKTTRAPIDALIKKEILKAEEFIIDRSILSDEEFFPTKPKQLNLEQQKTFEKIEHSLQNSLFQTHLIHGITGSGKTEIYLQAIDLAIAQGKGVIMLVPEIALTEQTIERLKSRFQTRIAILHCRLSNGERFDAWHGIRKGEIRIAIGARSAIFSPMPNLGLIIVDEEQEHSYKQFESAPCYHAKDIAVMRGKLTSATVLLGSATPSIESYYNATTGKYLLHTLTARATGIERPQVHIVNMRLENDKAKGYALFSDLLLSKIGDKIASGEQSILFLNRRGYYTCQMCTSCGKPQFCRHCDVALTYHKGEHSLSCHICGYSIPPYEKCFHCGSFETLKYTGPGTEQVERTLHAIFPNIRTLRMDGDTTKHKGSHTRLLKQFRAGKADVLIGTQMIAKGLHFPNVTLVGILCADRYLSIPDFRTNEDVFTMITQVAGRSGRSQMPGEVVIQSLLPDHSILKLAATENYPEFFQQELKDRELFQYPPFTKLIKFTFSGRDPDKVRRFAENYRTALQRKLDTTSELLPVLPCGYAKIKDHHRFQFLLKTKHILPVSHTLKTLNVKKLSSIKILVDINPISTW